jgi:hypothetical protein
MSFYPYTGALNSRQSGWAWQWLRWPLYRHQFTTQTIWRPGNVPYRARAWQPDVSGWTTARFQYDLLKWSRDRGVSPSTVVIDINRSSIE